MRAPRSIARRSVPAFLAALALLLPASPATVPASAQDGGDAFQGRFVLGFRSVDVSGADRKYREDLNLEDGPRLSQFDVLFEPETEEVKGLVDRVRLDVDDLGSDPFQSLRLEVRKFGRYSLDYSRIESDYFYEDQLFPAAVQSVRNARTGDFHHFDFRRTRDRANLKLDLSSRAKAHVGFERWHKVGESTTTIDIQRDEFEFDKPIDETLQDYVAGFQYSWDRITLAVEERYREYENAYEIFLPGRSEGETTTDSSVLDFFFLDQPYDYDSLESTVRMVARPTSRWTIRAAGTLQELGLDLRADERSQGVGFSGTPFTTDATGIGEIDRDATLVDVDVAYQVSPRVAVVGGAWVRDLDQDGDFVFDDTPREGRWEIETQGAKAGVQWAPTTEVTLAAGLRHEEREVRSGWIEGAGALELEDHEETSHDGWFGNVSWRPRKDLSLTVDYEDSSYDDPFTLVSPTDRSRLSVRGRWGAGEGLWASASYLLRETDNDGAAADSALDSGYESDWTQADVRVGWRGDGLDASVGYGLLEVDRRADRFVNTAGFGAGVSVLLPIDYSIDTDFLDGRVTWEASETWRFGGAFRLYDNGGEFGMDREDLRVFGEYAFTEGYLVQLGYRTVDYDEEAFDFDDYDADILELGVGYRW